MFKFLSGTRTYLCAIAIIIVAGLHALGYIDTTTYDLLYGLFGGAGLMALRAAVR